MDSFLQVKILFICFHFLFEAVHCNSFCSWSARTIVPVKNCPKTEESTRIRALFKACERLADVQNCTTPSKFKYHCLSTQTPGILVEVCAAEMDIKGVCLIYNTKLGKLQTYNNVNCKDIIPTCPDNYLSTVAHLYAPCYQFVDIFNFTRENKGNRTIVGEKEENTYHSITFLVIGITGLIMSVLCFFALIILWKVRYRIRRRKKSIVLSRSENEIFLGESSRCQTKKMEEEQFFLKESSLRQTNKNTSDIDFIRKTQPSLETEISVCSIYIGDKYCGMAYFDPKSPEDVVSLGNNEIIGVLLKKDGEVIEFGDKARKMFIEDGQDCRDYIFLDHDELDMEYWNDNICKLGSMKVVEVYQNIIGFLVTKIYKTITGHDSRTQEGTSCCESGSCMLCNMHCVITVPYHWKHNVAPLRRAFDRTMGDLHENMKIERLHIKLREVAISPYIHEVKASVSCLNFNVGNMTFNENTTYVNLHIGSKYCNLTFLKVQNVQCPDKIIGEPYRKKWRRTPEHQFVELFRDIFTPHIFYKWKTKYESEYVSLLCLLEDRKNKMRENMDEDEKYEFQLPSKLVELSKEGQLSLTDLEDGVAKHGGEFKKTESECTIVFRWSLLKTFFTHVKDSTKEIIIEHKETFAKKNVRCVIMTGSYSQMKLFLHEAEKEWFKELRHPVTVVVPVHIGSTYAMGAAYFFKKYPKWISNDLIK